MSREWGDHINGMFYKKGGTMRERIGALIKLARAGKGWSQAMLCEAAQISQASLSRIEDGEQDATIETLLRIAEVLTVEKSKGGL